MKVGVILAPRSWAIREVDLPEPGPREVRLRLEGCGLCASNLPVWEGRPWFRYPLAPGLPGHESWGRIDEIGPGLTGLRKGERVSAVADAAFADYVVVPAENLVRIPGALDRRPFPGEPLGCAVNVFRRSAIEAGQTVVIIGIGFMGAILTALARAAGARVIAVSRRRFALEAALGAGASHAVEYQSRPQTVDAVRSFLDSAGAARVIEAVGQQEALDIAGELVGFGGRLVIAGYHQDGARQVDLQTWNWKGIDVVNAHERDLAVIKAGIRTAVDLVANRTLDPFPLLTHCYPIEDIDRGFEAMARRPDGFMKGVAVFE